MSYYFCILTEVQEVEGDRTEEMRELLRELDMSVTVDEPIIESMDGGSAWVWVLVIKTPRPKYRAQKVRETLRKIEERCKVRVDYLKDIGVHGYEWTVN